MDVVSLAMDFLSKSFDEAKHPRDKQGRFSASRTAGSSVPKAREYTGLGFELGEVITDGTAVGRVVGTIKYDGKHPVVQVSKLNKKFLSSFPERSNNRAFLYDPRDGSVYCAYSVSVSHEAISDALKKDNLSLVHFYVFDNKIMVSSEYGGLGEWSFDSRMPRDEFHAKALGNIYSGVEKLTKLGLPSSTKLRISGDGSIIETTLGMEKSMDYLAKYGTSEGALRGWVKRRGALGTYQQATEAKFRQKKFKRNTYGLPARYTAGRGAEIASQVDAARAAIRTSAAARSINSLVPLLGGYNSLRPGVKSMTLKKQVEIAIKGGKGSGNRGHAGRPGQRGGSAPRGEGDDGFGTAELGGEPFTGRPKFVVHVAGYDDPHNMKAIAVLEIPISHSDEARAIAERAAKKIGKLTDWKRVVELSLRDEFGRIKPEVDKIVEEANAEFRKLKRDIGKSNREKRVAADTNWNEAERGAQPDEILKEFKDAGGAKISGRNERFGNIVLSLEERTRAGRKETHGTYYTSGGNVISLVESGENIRHVLPAIRNGVREAEKLHPTWKREDFMKMDSQKSREIAKQFMDTIWRHVTEYRKTHGDNPEE